MFWQSVLGGFSLLAHWKFWAFGFLYAFLYINLKILVNSNASEYESNFLYKSRFFLFLAMSGILVAVFTTLLMPILFGKSELAPLSAISSQFLFLILIGALAGIATYFALKWSVIGAFLADVPGVVVFIEALTLCINLVNSDYGKNIHLSFTLPSLFYSIGYFVAFIIVATLVVGVVMFILEKLGADISSALMKMLVMQTTGFFMGLIGLSMFIHHAQFASLLHQ